MTTKTSYVELNKPFIGFGVPCIICGETVPLPEEDVMKLEHGMHIHSRVCTSCKEAVLYIKKEMSLKASQDSGTVEEHPIEDNDTVEEPIYAQVYKSVEGINFQPIYRCGNCGQRFNYTGLDFMKMDPTECPFCKCRFVGIL